MKLIFHFVQLQQWSGPLGDPERGQRKIHVRGQGGFRRVVRCRRAEGLNQFTALGDVLDERCMPLPARPAVVEHEPFDLVPVEELLDRHLAAELVLVGPVAFVIVKPLHGDHVIALHIHEPALSLEDELLLAAEPDAGFLLEVVQRFRIGVDRRGVPLRRDARVRRDVDLDPFPAIWEGSKQE